MISILRGNIIVKVLLGFLTLFLVGILYETNTHIGLSLNEYSSFSIQLKTRIRNP